MASLRQGAGVFGRRALKDKERVKFYYDNGTYRTVEVDETTTAADVFSFLSSKTNLPEYVDWAIIENLASLDLERSMEDHEMILNRRKLWKETHDEFDDDKFCFRKDVFERYNYLKDPANYFLLNMVYPVDEEGNCLNTSTEREKSEAMEKMLTTTSSAPIVFGYMYVKMRVIDNWAKIYFVLRNATLYYSEDVPITNEIDVSQMQAMLMLHDFDVYFMDITERFKPAWKSCFCLKACPDVLERNPKSAICPIFACENDAVKFGWITATRLHKYGQQLRDNYERYKLLKYNNPNAPGGPKLAVGMQPISLGAEGGVGYVTEAMKSLELSADPWCPPIAGGILKDLKSTIHLSEPWFYSTLDERQATACLMKYLTIKGLFLVRHAGENQENCKFVVSYISEAGVTNCNICAVDEQGRIQTDENKPMYLMLKPEMIGTTDPKDRPKPQIFYDLVQLVEFHYLNKGCLQNRLSHHIRPDDL